MSQLLNPARQYATIKFPEYRYQEYPKWVTKQDGSKVIVQDQHEELKVVSEPASGAPVEPSPLEQERDSLAKQVAELRAQLAAASKPAQAAVSAPPKVAPTK